MKVSMTPWLDGSRWPLVESELWYNTRLLEDTAEAEEVAGACHAGPDPSPHHQAVPEGVWDGKVAPHHLLSLSRLEPQSHTPQLSGLINPAWLQAARVWPPQPQHSLQACQRSPVNRRRG